MAPGDKVLQVTPPAANKVAKYLVNPTIHHHAIRCWFNVFIIAT